MTYGLSKSSCMMISFGINDMRYILIATVIALLFGAMTYAKGDALGSVQDEGVGKMTDANDLLERCDYDGNRKIDGFPINIDAVKKEKELLGLFDNNGFPEASCALVYAVATEERLNVAVVSACDYNNKKIDGRLGYKVLEKKYRDDGEVSPVELKKLDSYKKNAKNERKCKLKLETAILEKKVAEKEKKVAEHGRQAAKLLELMALLSREDFIAERERIRLELQNKNMSRGKREALEYLLRESESIAKKYGIQVK